MQSTFDFAPLLPALSHQLAPLASAWPWLPAAFLGVGLAASSGLRAFLPLLLLSAAFKWHLLGLASAPGFAWLASDTAFLALLLATVVEIAGDKIPAVDHALDVFATIVRPVAGALAAASVFQTGDPATAALLGLVVGAPLALGVHAAKATTRGASTLSTAGLGNPVLSVLEDGCALFLILVALLLPFLVPLILGVAAWLTWKIVVLARRLGASRAKNRPGVA